MKTPIEDQLRDYFTMVDRMQGPVDSTLQTAKDPTLRLVTVSTEDAADSATELMKLGPDRTEPRNRSRTWMLIAASVAALVGGLVVVANRDSDPAPAEQPVVAVTDPALVGTQPPGTASPSTESSGPKEIAITPEGLQGFWLNTVGAASLLVEFRPDGTFTLGDTGRLGNGTYTNGTFGVDDETMITFRTADDASDCPGVTMTWTDVVNDGDGVMTVEALAPDCRVPAGSQWELTRVSPASTASLELQAGDLDVEPVPATESLEIEGLWLRVGTGDVLAIDPAGTYLVSSDGNSLRPLDSGTYDLQAPGVLTFTSDGSGECNAGEVWMWQGVTTAKDLQRENQARGSSMRADSAELCRSAVGGDSWRLLSPEKT
ncbi:hypothetical protein [Ilumatobacter sp.]|uniref:hypothetical protein n=1 Tax=Ilumatobacter sp. TaxID=1967498 RepID=UPI003C31FECB